MSDLDFKLIVLGAVVVVALVVAFRFRSRFKMWLKFGKIEAGVEGGNNTAPPDSPAPTAKGNTATASGDGAVAIGGDAPGATIHTGSNKPDSKPG